MLPCVCSVIDHRWRQIVVRTKSGTRGVTECVTDVLTTFWRLLLSITESDARQHGIYLFYIVTKIFQHNAKAGLLPRLYPAFARKKAIWSWRDLWSFQNEAISLVAMVSKELWLVEKNLSLVSLFVEWKLTAKAKLNCKIYKSLRKCWKNQVSFCHRSTEPCEPKSLDVALKITGVEKIPSENLWLRST